MDNECEKSADGKHEIDFEKLTYQRHVGLHAAMFDIVCLHCGALGDVTIESDSADWI